MRVSSRLPSFIPQLKNPRIFKEIIRPKESESLEKEISDRLKESFWCEKYGCRLLKNACDKRKKRAKEIFRDNKMKNSIGMALKESFAPCHNCTEGA